ncbi:MAG: hypothetical protein NW200_12060 [Hyphomonadaceae bacterium]|nr:hypothetical protein [Hyphomonadaceae bacterium]
MRWLILLTLLLSACATAPAPDKRALAAEVFALSGGLEDMKLMARYAPLLVQGEDVKARCLEALGRDPNPLARAACDMAESAARGLARGQGGL